MWHAQKQDLAWLGLTKTRTLLPPHPPKRSPWSHPATSSPPPPHPLNVSLLPRTLCGLSCMLTVPKHDEPFSPMGISPPSKPASATSVFVSQSGCNGSSGSSSDLAQASGSLSVTFCFNLAERRHTSSSSAHSGRKSSPSFSSAPWADSTHSWMSEEGCPATWGYFSHLDTRWTHWAADWGDVMLSSAPLEQGWPQPPGVHVSSYSSSSFSSASVLPSGMRGSKSAGFLIHHQPPSDCVVILFLSAALDLKASQAKQRD